MYGKGRVPAILSLILVIILTLPVLNLSASDSEPNPIPTAELVNNESLGFPSGWTDDIQMTLLPGLGTHVWPVIATNGDTIHLVWENRTSTHSIGYRRSEDAGRTWTESKIITSGEVGNPRIAINGSNIHLVYMQDTGITSEIMYQNSTDNGETWSLPVMLSLDDGVWCAIPDIAVDGDNIHVVWEDEDASGPGSYEIIYRNSTNGGISWNPTIQLTNYPGGSDASAKIAVNGSLVHVVWGRFVTASGSFETMYRRSLDGGSTWEAEMQITKPGSGHSYAPDLAVNGSSIYAIWMDSRNGAWETYINISYDDGVSWNGGIALSDIDGEFSWVPIVDVWNQTVYVMWTDRRDDYPYTDAQEIYMNYSFDSGVTWQDENKRLTLALNNSAVNDIVVTEDYIHVVSVDNKTGKREIYYKRYPDFPADTTPPTIIHTPITGTPIGQSINISCQVSDNVALSEVWLNYTGVNGTNYNVSMTGWNLKKVMVSGLGQTLYAQDGNYSLEIPAQNGVGVLSYFIWTNDTSDNDNWTVTYQVQIFDITKPTINHVPVASSKINEPIDIVVNVTDNGEVANVTLYYENVGDITYTAVDMTLISGDWTATIPAQTVTGLAHYFIWANDTSGNNITSPVMGDYAIQITGPPSIDITNLIGDEDWTGGSNHQIEFSATDTEDSPAVLDVFLNYTSSAGNGVIASIKGNDSPYDWTLPTINATDVIVNATVIDLDGNKSYDDSLEFMIDSSPPKVISTNPVNNTTGNSIFQPIVIQFNEPMNISSVTVNQTNGTDPGGWNWYWNEDKDVITGIHNPWERGRYIEMTAQPNYSDNSNPGNSNNTTYVFSFTTETNPSPEIIHTNISSPQELGDEMRINTTITDDGEVMNAVLWWQGVDDVWHENFMDKNGDDWEYFIPGQVTEGKVKYQINATDDLQQKNTTIIYEFDIEDTTPPVIVHTPVESAVVGEAINITCQITDLGGVDVVNLYYKNESASNFTQVTMNQGYWFELSAQTVPNTIEYYIHAFDIYGNDVATQTYTLEIIDTFVPDTTPPKVLFVSPTGNNVPISTSISIVFNEAMNQTSVENAISVSPTITGIGYTWLNNQTLTIEISGNLSYNTTYTVSIGTGAKDLCRNTLENDYSWQFTTAEEPEIVQTPASNDWGWIGIIIFLITIIVLLVLSPQMQDKPK